MALWCHRELTGKILKLWARIKIKLRWISIRGCIVARKSTNSYSQVSLEVAIWRELQSTTIVRLKAMLSALPRIGRPKVAWPNLSMQDQPMLTPSGKGRSNSPLLFSNSQIRCTMLPSQRKPLISIICLKITQIRASNLWEGQLRDWAARQTLSLSSVSRHQNHWGETMKDTMPTLRNSPIFPLQCSVPRQLTALGPKPLAIREICREKRRGTLQSRVRLARKLPGSKCSRVAKLWSPLQMLNEIRFQEVMLKFTSSSWAVFPITPIKRQSRRCQVPDM